MKKHLLAFVAIAALVAGACSSGSKSAKTTATTKAPPSTTTTTAPVKVASPLTGLPIEEDVAARPVVSVKVDNSPDGRPIQAGIDKADVLFEEKVEGTVTRFIAMFQSTDPDLVGPIRSVRHTDANIVSAFGGVFTFSGGAPIAVKSLDGAPVTKVTESSGQGDFVYPPGHHRPYATYAKTEKLRKEASKDAHAPPPILPFLASGESFAPQGAAPAAKAVVQFGRQTIGTLDWDPASSRWLRSTNGVSQTIQGGGQLSFATVIIQSVGYRPVGYNDAAHNPVDQAIVVGEGDAVILAAGTQIKAHWKKESPTAMTTFTDATGTPIRVPQGPVLIMLPPTTGGVITIT